MINEFPSRLRCDLNLANSRRLGIGKFFRPSTYSGVMPRSMEFCRRGQLQAYEGMYMALGDKLIQSNAESG